MNYAPYSPVIKRIMADPVKAELFDEALSLISKGHADALSITVNTNDDDPHYFTSKPDILQYKMDNNQDVIIIDLDREFSNLAASEH